MNYVDSMNRFRTESLFYETCRSQMKQVYPPVYTLKPYEKYGLPSAYEIYMNSVNEYDAAMKIVGSMRHWRKLLGLNWFMKGNELQGFDGLEQWREDKAMKDQAESIKLLKEQAEKGNVSAQKILHDNSKKGAVGRPKKKTEDKDLEKEQEKKIASIHKDLVKKNKENNDQ